MISDPSQFLQRVIEEVLARSTNTGDARVDLDAGDDEGHLARALGEHLAGLFTPEPDDPGGPDQAWPENGIDPALIAHYEDLLNRNAMLARALGACYCWGEDERCTVCMGEGVPGWRIPDSRLYSRFVRPAGRTLQQSFGVVPRPLRTTNGSMPWR